MFVMIAFDKTVVKPGLSPAESPKCVDAFSGQHTSALDRAKIETLLAGAPAPGRSNWCTQMRCKKPTFTTPGGTPLGMASLGLL